MNNTGHPLVVVWRVTEACDLGCHFCAYSRQLRRSRASANPEQVMAFGALLGRYAEAFSRPVLVSWLGGEPLRWAPLFEISRAFKREFGLQVSATTNGTALRSATVRGQVAELFDSLTVSVDGLGATHDGLRDAPGLFEQLRASLAELRLHRRPRLRANTILMQDTVYNFPRLCEMLADWGIVELTFNALGGRDRPEFFPDHRLRPEHLDWLRAELPALRERLAQRGLTVLGDDVYLGRLAASAHQQLWPVADCAPGQQFLFVDEGGFVSPCSFTSQGYGLPVSEICSVADLHHLPERFAARQRERRLAPCYDCPSTQVFGKFAHGSNVSLIQ